MPIRFNPCMPCCKQIYMFDHNSWAATLRNLYITSGFQVTHDTSYQIEIPGRLDGHKLLILNTFLLLADSLGNVNMTIVNNIKSWFETGGKRLVLWNPYSFWANAYWSNLTNSTASYNNFTSLVRATGNTLMSELGSTMTIETEGVISTLSCPQLPPFVAAESTAACAIGNFVGSHYLKNGLTYWDEVGGGQRGHYSEPFGPNYSWSIRIGASRINNGTALVSYGDSNSITSGSTPATVMAVEKVGDSEIVFEGGTAGFMDYPFFGSLGEPYLTCHDNRDIFVLRLMDDVQ